MCWSRSFGCKQLIWAHRRRICIHTSQNVSTHDVMDPGRKSPAVGRRAIIFVLTLTPVLFLPPHAHAQDASKILKAMSDYVTGQKTLTSSGQVLLNRPDKLRATRTGGYADVELVFDGKTATVLA